MSHPLSKGRASAQIDKAWLGWVRSLYSDLIKLRSTWHCPEAPVIAYVFNGGVVVVCRYCAASERYSEPMDTGETALAKTDRFVEAHTHGLVPTGDLP